MNFKEWLILTEAKKSSDIARELLGNNENLFNQIKAIIPTNIKQDLQAKLLPIAAYYYKQHPDLNTLKQDIFKYANLVIKQKMPIITVKDDHTIDNKHFQNYIGWTQIIHGKEAEDKVSNAPVPQGNLENQELIAKSTDGRIKVYKANSVNQCIILGKGEKFCISQPANTMFQSYRDSKVSTFYFVYDNTRTDELAIVVIDATQHGIELTDRKNQTAQTMQDPYSNTPKRIQSDPQLYFKYLQQHGIDTSIFKNISKTKEETAEQEKLGKQNNDLQWFMSLTPEEKSKYIGRGHGLSNEQFDFLYDNKFMLLLTQYVKLGRQINDYQLEKVAKVRDLKDNYLHNRLIADQQTDNLSKKEYELLSPKQKEEFFNVDADTKFKKAHRIGDLEKQKEAIRDGAKSDDVFQIAIKNGSLDIVKYLVDEKGAKIPDYAVSYASKSGQLDIVKYLVEKGANIDGYAVDSAAYNGHLDVLKYLVDEKGANIGNAVSNAAEKGHLDVLKYLVDEKGANISNTVAFAAANGQLDIVKYLVDEKGAKIHDDTVSNAAYNGHLDVLKYLVDEKGAKIHDDTVSNAAANGRLDVLKYLVDEKGAKINDDTVAFAVGNGHTNILIYLIEKGAKINITVSDAARMGDLDLVKHLVKNGYFIGDEAISIARTQEIKDYLIQKQKEQQINIT